MWCVHKFYHVSTLLDLLNKTTNGSSIGLDYDLARFNLTQRNFKSDAMVQKYSRLSQRLVGTHPGVFEPVVRQFVA